MGSIESVLPPSNRKLTASDENNSINSSNPYSGKDATSASEQFLAILDKFETRAQTSLNRRSSGVVLRQSIQNEIVDVANTLEQKMPKSLKLSEEASSSKTVEPPIRNLNKSVPNELPSRESKVIKTLKEPVATDEEEISDNLQEEVIPEKLVTKDEVIEEEKSDIGKYEILNIQEMVTTPEKIFYQEPVLAEEGNTVDDLQIMEGNVSVHSDYIGRWGEPLDKLNQPEQNVATEDSTIGSEKKLNNNEDAITAGDIIINDTTITSDESLFEVPVEQITSENLDSEQNFSVDDSALKKLVESPDRLVPDTAFEKQPKNEREGFSHSREQAQIESVPTSLVETGTKVTDNGEYEVGKILNEGADIASSHINEPTSIPPVKPEAHPALLSLSNNVIGRVASAEELSSKTLSTSGGKNAADPATAINQVASHSQLALRASGGQRGSSNNTATTTALPLQQQGEMHRSTEEKKMPRLPPSLHSRLLEHVKKMLHDVEQLTKNGSSLSFRLDPPQLGNVHVYMRVHGGTLHARISPDNSEVVNFLRDKGGEIHESLRKVGLSFEEIKVSFGGTDISQGGDNQFQGSSQQDTNGSLYNQMNFLSNLSDAAPIMSAVKAQHLSSTSNVVKDHWVA